MACHRSYRSTLYRFGTVFTINVSMELQRNNIITYLSFRQTGIMAYNTNVDHRSKLLNSSSFQKNALMLASRKRYVGFITPNLKKRMQKAITLLLQSTPYKYQTHPVTGRTVAHKISFITLTTPTHENSYDSKFCHKHLLEPLLRILRNRYGMKSYIWKVELQANKQIHYHITTEIMINHTVLRNIWNGLLNKHDMLDGFKANYGHSNPNSTDIHAVQKINNIEAYLVKYICKEYQNEDKLSSKVWDCSKNLKSAGYFKTALDFGTHQVIRQLQDVKHIITHYFEKAVYLDFKTTDYYSHFNDTIKQDYFTHLENIASWQNLFTSTKELAQKTIATIKMTSPTKLQIQSHGYTLIKKLYKRAQLAFTFPSYTTLLLWSQISIKKGNYTPHYQI